MDISEKLIKLRKQNNLTQEELANKLFVSRTAVSKWESGHGFPSIDSLKQIAEFFKISIDELINTNELIVIAEKDKKDKTNSVLDLIFGVVDLLSLLLFFLPIYGTTDNGVIISVSLINLKQFVQLNIYVIYVIISSCLFLYGIVELCLQNVKNEKWVKSKRFISLLIGGMCLVFNILSAQPYASFYLLSLIAFKTLFIIKNK